MSGKAIARKNERDVVWNGDRFQKVPEGAYVDNKENA